MTDKEFSIRYTEYKSQKEMTGQENELIKEAKQAAQNAYAPYSGFKVGAAVLLENGKIITGNNQENAAYPSGLCAERVALFYANANYPDIAVKVVAICAYNKNGLLKNPVAPCGSCRQVMLETEIRFNTKIKTILVGEKNINVIDGITQLLPFNFSNKDL
jgi:cytidine deaminase